MYMALPVVYYMNNVQLQLLVSLDIRLNVQKLPTQTGGQYSKNQRDKNSLPEGFEPSRVSAYT